MDAQSDHKSVSPNQGYYLVKYENSLCMLLSLIHISLSGVVAWQGDHWEESGVGLIVENKGTITEPEERREVMKNRLSDFIIIDKNEISSLFLPFDGKHTVLGFSLIDNSMSNTGYADTTTSGKRCV